MPGYHVVVGARSMINGDMMELLSSMRPGRMAVYQWRHPIGAFKLPMDSMGRLEGSRDLDYDQLETYLNGSEYYWIGRVYKSYSGNLDAYIKFKGEGRVTRYILEYDPADVSMSWPQPCDFYLARRAIRTQESMPLQAYNATGTWEHMVRAVPLAPMRAVPLAPMAPPTAASIALIQALALEPAIIQAAAIEAVPAAMGEAAIPAAPVAMGDAAGTTMNEAVNDAENTIDEAAAPVAMDD